MLRIIARIFVLVGKIVFRVIYSVFQVILQVGLGFILITQGLS